MYTCRSMLSLFSVYNITYFANIFHLLYDQVTEKDAINLKYSLVDKYFFVICQAFGILLSYCS